MTTSSEAFITSIRIEKGRGSHDYVTVWIRGANVGTLCVGKGDGEHLEFVLQGCICICDGFFEKFGCHHMGCPVPGAHFIPCVREPPAVFQRGTATIADGSVVQLADPEGVLGVQVREATDEEQRLALERALPFVMKGPLAGAPRLRPEGPWSTHQPTQQAEAGIGAPAPSRDDASKAEVESRPLGVPPAAGAPPTMDLRTHVPESARTEVP